MTWPCPPTGNSRQPPPAELFSTIRSSFGIGLLRFDRLPMDLDPIRELEDVVDCRKDPVLLSAGIIFGEVTLSHQRLQKVLQAIRVGRALARILKEAFRLGVVVTPCRQRRRREYLPLAKVFNVRGEEIKNSDKSDHPLQLHLQVGLWLLIGGEVITVVALLQTKPEHFEECPAGSLIQLQPGEQIRVFT